MPKLGVFLKEHRLQRGLSVEQAAENINISRSLLYDYEADKVFPNGKNLIKLARFYRFSLDALFTLSPEQNHAIPLYNAQGKPIYLSFFPPSQGAYYLLDAHHLVFVQNNRHYRSNTFVLAHDKEKMRIFFLVHNENQFYLLDKNGRLTAFVDKRMQLIGTIYQFIYLFGQD